MMTTMMMVMTFQVPKKDATSSRNVTDSTSATLTGNKLAVPFYSFWQCKYIYWFCRWNISRQLMIVTCSGNIKIT